MDLLEKFAQKKKKKKTLVLTNVGKKAGGRYYIPAEKGRWGQGGLHTCQLENFRTISSGKQKKPWY
jgi:hypothetical protein